DDTDGCDRYCDLAGADPASSKACPGTEVNLWGTDVVYDGSTAALVGQGNCSIDKACPGTSGNQATNGAAEPERIFHVTAHKTGTLSVQTTNVDFDNFLYAADHCTLDPPSPIDPYLKCANGAAGIGPETLIMAVDAGKSYTIVVDGSGIVLDAPDRGNFRVTFSLY
ncbi:MAG TPA: hypothetical protein VIF62_08610, partial [Labilithrix sp.]